MDKNNKPKRCSNCKNYKGGFCKITGQFVPISFKCGLYKEK